jgi:hypothetical protein
MKFKKSLLSGLALATGLAFTAGSTPVSASSGWDKIRSGEVAYGYSYERPYDNSGLLNKYYSVESTGGDFSVLIDPQTGVHGTIYVKLWEEDEEGNAPEYVGLRKVSGTSGLVRARWDNIGGYVDGSNDRAEFYIEISGSNYDQEFSYLGYYD